MTPKERRDRLRSLPADDSSIEAYALEEQWERTKAAQRKQERIIAAVFHRNGEPAVVLQVMAGRLQGCGCLGRIPHDFRRTAVRNLVRAGASPKRPR